jgi:type IV secretion system protein VirB11
MNAHAAVRQRNLDKLVDELGSILSLMENPNVEDIFINPDGSVWVTQCGQAPVLTAGVVEPEQVRSIINVAASVNGAVATKESPIVEVILPVGNCRFEGLLPPVVSSPTIAIRTLPRTVRTLGDYLESDTMTGVQCEAICTAIVEHRNILIVGATGAGKTTLLNACLNAMASLTPDDRVVSIEDIAELRVVSPNCVSLYATPPITMQRCVKTAMRLRPNRILVGEVRGKEALDLLKAWNTGHPGGVATVHADSAYMGLLRLEQLAREATRAPQRQFIAQTVHMVVFIAPDSSTKSGRRVREVVAVRGIAAGKYDIEVLG